jgi:carbon monoxide dehydrogenase subunit G
MGKMNLSIEIDAVPEAVFDMIADIENSAAHIEGIEKVEMLTEGPVGVGTKWRETRLMMKKQAVEEMEITSFERPTHYTVYCDSSGYDIDWTMRVEPRATAARSRWT